MWLLQYVNRDPGPPDYDYEVSSFVCMVPYPIWGYVVKSGSLHSQVSINNNIGGLKKNDMILTYHIIAPSE